MGARPSRVVILWSLLLLALADALACGALLLWSRACCSQSLDRLDADRIVVLLYGARPDLDLRIPEAERLLRLNASASFLCAGGARPDRDVFHCEEVVDELAKDGFDRARLTADTKSFDTIGNLAATFDVAGPDRVPVIVSDSLHLLRVSRLIAALAPSRRYETSATHGPEGAYLLL